MGRNEDHSLRDLHLAWALQLSICVSSPFLLSAKPTQIIDLYSCAVVVIQGRVWEPSCAKRKAKDAYYSEVSQIGP